ncbi:MAG: hypothetical protein LUQ26_04685 [Methylococcaceae bacterium]|nr:hypothetical protein [Methylococcaceae bacterium]
MAFNDFMPMNGAYTRNPLAEKHVIGKDKTWEIERKHTLYELGLNVLCGKQFVFQN